MEAWLPALGVGVVVAALAAFVLLARRARRQGTDHSFLGPFEDMWNPAAHRAETVVRAEAERPAPSPAPGDPPVALGGAAVGRDPGASDQGVPGPHRTGRPETGGR
ncbi:hypothetical protein [Nakamurella endophytica]|uniref:Uncharacterized protein n=1 Tax=Nakamurella endophytica TaxID=1748367 RepID=A0A917WMI6_9ACTN|nr:hypothetical protein [Nakamurella endophytica]GGM15238.1 hypothetical protein GCM10011594_39050 [Nakamurella endophytica]